MTTSDCELNRTDPAETRESPPGDYEVGRGKPPRAHQFQKGNRANPGGKKRKVKPSDELVPQLPAESVHQMLMAEANRMVRVKAGGRFVEVPAMQAAFREIAMKAARGNRLATATLARLVMQSEGVEARAAAERAAAAPAPSHQPTRSGTRVPAGAQPGYEAAVEYREVWARLLTRAALEKADIAAPAPHPDEVTIGQVRGTVGWPGAQPGETLSLDGLAATHAEWQAALPARRAVIEAMLEGYDKAVAWCEWFALDDARQLIAAHLPQRYAGQIQADTRRSEERARDRSLRTMAQHDRERHERRVREDALRERERERAAGLAPREGDEDGDDDDGTDAATPGAGAAGPSRTVAAASAYRAAWLDLREASEALEVQPGAPMPPPEDVIIDAEAGTVTYRTPPPAGQRATLASLRATLTRMKALAAGHDAAMACAPYPQRMFIAQRRRDEALRYCAVIERHLGGVKRGRG
jgi:hypothetical protein